MRTPEETSDLARRYRFYLLAETGIETDYFNDLVICLAPLEDYLSYNIHKKPSATRSQSEIDDEKREYEDSFVKAAQEFRTYEEYLRSRAERDDVPADLIETLLSAEQAKKLQEASIELQNYMRSIKKFDECDHRKLNDLFEKMTVLTYGKRGEQAKERFIANILSFERKQCRLVIKDELKRAKNAPDSH